MSAATLRSETHPRPATDGALQRARGRLDLILNSKDGRTYPERVFQESALKVRFPRQRSESSEAILLNMAGGLAGGDVMDMRITAKANTHGIITSQACERVYRSLGDDAHIQTTLTLSPGARLEWLPQPTILFDGGRLARMTEIEMAEDARLLAVESVIFGRSAMQERVHVGSLSDAWRIRRSGTLIYADTFRLDGAIQVMLDKPSVLNGAHAFASFVYVAPDAQSRLEEVRGLLSDLKGNTSASSWNGLLVIRLTAEDGYNLNKDMTQFLTCFRGASLPRVWSL